MVSIMVGAAMLSVGMYLALSPWTLQTYLAQALAGDPITVFGIGVPTSPGNPSHWIVGSGIVLMAIGLAALAEGITDQIGRHIAALPGPDTQTMKKVEVLGKSGGQTGRSDRRGR